MAQAIQTPAPATVSIRDASTTDLYKMLSECGQRLQKERGMFVNIQQEINDRMGIVGAPSNGGSQATAVTSSSSNLPKSKHAPAATTAAAAPPSKHAAAATTKTEVAPTRKAPGEKVAPGERNYSNERTLPEAVWHVLDRAAHAEGLKVSEIVDVIENEKLFISSSPDISNMVQGTVYKLKKANKLVRGNNHRYYIPEGATLGKEEAAAASE